MAARFKPVGIGMSAPTPWRAPDDYVRGEVPRVPGIYLLRCVQEDGTPVPLKPASEHRDLMRRQIEDHPLLQGVLYIGLAGRPIGQNDRPSRNTLRQRFAGDLLGSWRASARPRAQGDWRHHSRDHYEAMDVTFRQRFPLSRIQACYIPMVPSAWLKKVPGDVQSASDAFDWDAANEYVGLREAQLIQEYKRLYGGIPPLNDREEGAADVGMSEEDLNSHLARMEQELGTLPSLQYADDTAYLYCDIEQAERLAEELVSLGHNAEVQDAALEMGELPPDAPSVRSLIQASGDANLGEAVAVFTARGEGEAVVIIHPPIDEQAIEDTVNAISLELLQTPDKDDEED